MERLSRIRATNLFGYLNQTIKLSEEGITILHGANGSGKTTLLKCLSEVSLGEWPTLSYRPIEKLNLFFESGNNFEYDSNKENNETFKYTRKNHSYLWVVSKDEVVAYKEFREHQLMLARHGTAARKHLMRYREDISVWPDETTPSHTVANLEMWNFFKSINNKSNTDPPPKWLLEFREVFHCTLIEEQRLIRFEQEAEKAPRFTRVVSDYSKKIVSTIDDVIRRYGEKTQQLERTFPMRLIDALSLSPPEPAELEANFNLIDTHRSRLQSAGLIGTEASVRLDRPGLESLEVRRLLWIYAKDILEKLALFDDIYHKITLFEKLIREYFSRKTVKISKGGIEITTEAGQRLGVTALSSGEQHIFVLFFRLIFVEPKAQHLVLIDEPELSLHPKWQIRFVDDLERIRAVSKLDFILASHSPLIFQGHSELGRDLEI